jgi:hypothetical protein
MLSEKGIDIRQNKMLLDMQKNEKKKGIQLMRLEPESSCSFKTKALSQLWGTIFVIALTHPFRYILL